MIDFFKHISWPSWIVFAGALLSALGAIFSSFRNEANANKAKEIAEQREADRKSFQGELKTRNDKIDELNELIYGSLTGGSRLLLQGNHF